MYILYCNQSWNPCVVAGYRHPALAASDKNTGTPSQSSVDQQQAGQQSSVVAQQPPAPPVVRITLASMEECNVLLHNGLDFYGATFFPVEAASPVSLKKKPLAPNRYVVRYVVQRVLVLSDKSNGFRFISQFFTFSFFFF